MVGPWIASKLAPTGLAGRVQASAARRRAFRKSELARDHALTQFTRDGEARIASKLAPTELAGRVQTSAARRRAFRRRELARDQGLAQFRRGGEARIADRQQAGLLQSWQDEYRRQPLAVALFVGASSLAIRGWLSSRRAVKRGSPASWLLQDWQGEYRRQLLAVALFVGESSLAIMR